MREARRSWRRGKLGSSQTRANLRALCDHQARRGQLREAGRGAENSRTGEDAVWDSKCSVNCCRLVYGQLDNAQAVG